MYIPAGFQVGDRDTLHTFIEQYSFAVLITNIDNVPFATHLPLLLDRDRGPFGTLLGHFARPNPHVQAFDKPFDSLAVFHGPHAYISPSWYSGKSPAVPTWNYAAVHAYGRAEPIVDDAWTRDLLERMVETYEARFESPWQDNLNDELREKLIRSVVGFELPISRLEGKFKLGQNRSLEDQEGALAGLERAGSLELADFVRRNPPVKSN